MFSRILKRVTYVNVAMTLVLVFAMSGGAFAAGKYLITSTKQIKPSVLKQLTGKAGPAGKNGTNGANGANGAPGEKGAPGANGTNGANGANGSSVGSTALASKNANCPEGGSEFTAAENKKSYACNGSPWTAGGTLPAKKTETGTWGFSAHAEGDQLEHFDFPIPLKEPLEAENTHLILPNGKEEKGNHVEAEQTACPGTVEEPKAEPGNFCAYIQATVGEGVFGSFGFRYRSGIIGVFEVTKSEAGFGYAAFGSWAVTAPEETS